MAKTGSVPDVNGACHSLLTAEWLFMKLVNLTFRTRLIQKFMFLLFYVLVDLYDRNRMFQHPVNHARFDVLSVALV